MGRSVRIFWKASVPPIAAPEWTLIPGRSWHSKLRPRSAQSSAVRRGSTYRPSAEREKELTHVLLPRSHAVYPDDVPLGLVGEVSAGTSDPHQASP